MHTRTLAAALACTMTFLVACGDDDDGAAPPRQPAGEKAETVSSEVPARRDPIVVTATDYAFDLPATFPGGLVSMELVNDGAEPHFAAFTRPVEGATIEDVRAAINAAESGAAPTGPPPFVEYAALGTVDPGGTSRMTVNLPAGEYLVYCALPSPKGKTHNLLGMMSEVEVAPGRTQGLPDTQGTVPVADFAMGEIPDLHAGTNTLTMENRGRQIHELDLVELGEGMTMDDAVAWARKPAGPPPFRFLGGPAIRDGLSAVGTFELKAGVRYAFVCIVPDFLGDMALHLSKGMYTPIFEVTG